MNSKALVGIGIAAAAGIGLLIASEGESSANPGSKELPGGGTKDDLATATTVALTTQHIPDIQAAIRAWNDASDPLTSGAIAFTLDGALAKQNLAQWTPDGQKGSPLLRAFGLRIQQLEGRPDLLRIWAKAWKTILPKLSEELLKKAGGIRASSENGTKDDPVPPAELVERIEDAVSSGDTALMRELADELERLGFGDAARDLRAAAKAIEDSKVEPPAPPPPGPAPSQPKPAQPKPKPAQPKPKQPAALPTGAGRIYLVLSGDNPSKIAKKLTGDGNRFRELVSANVPPKVKAKDGGFTKLFAGERLKVPASWPAHPEAVRGTATTPAPDSPGPAPSPRPTSNLATTVVQSGDGFTRITTRLGQPQSRWRELRDANIPKDADGRSRSKDTDAKGGIKPILQPGQRLFVPASFGAASPALPPSPASPSSPAPTPVGGPRFFVVRPGDGPARIATHLTGVESRWRELVKENSPPKTIDPKTGSFKFLNPGEKLKIPASWPAHPEMVFAGDMLARVSNVENMSQRRAGMVGLNAHLGKSNPEFLRQFQADHGIEATGVYGPATAIILLAKYGMVPPVPHTWGTKEKATRQKYADTMYQAAKRDPQRRDEFRRAALQALGKVA